MNRKWSAVLIAMAALTIGPQPAQAADWYFKPAANHRPATTEPQYLRLLNRYNGIFIGNTHRKEIFLTFDNGYEAGHTAAILDTLKREHVPAIFFITGHYIDSQPALVRRMVREGHLVGNHSWSHPDLSAIDDARYQSELDRLKAAYTKLTGKKEMHYLRPPRGTFSERSLRLADKAGYISVFWSAAYKDWVRGSERGADYAYDQIMRRMHPGAIVLLHTVLKDNADALPRVIQELKREGYQFRSLDDLTAKRTMPPALNP
ncbi:MAG: delta-lactam-biosynthetic de-N-acetylase [Sporolactobacillus sp.]